MSVCSALSSPISACIACYIFYFVQSIVHIRLQQRTGIYMVTKLFPQLGIDKDVAAKSSNAGIAAVAKGEAEIAIQPVSELLHVPGTDFVGALPQQIQYISVFAAARVANSSQDQQAGQLIGFLASQKAAAAIRDSGMEPLQASTSRR